MEGIRDPSPPKLPKYLKFVRIVSLLFPYCFTKKKAGNSGISSETAGPGISSETAGPEIPLTPNPPTRSVREVCHSSIHIRLGLSYLDYSINSQSPRNRRSRFPESSESTFPTSPKIPMDFSRIFPWFFPDLSRTFSDEFLRKIEIFFQDNYILMYIWFIFSVINRVKNLKDLRKKRCMYLCTPKNNQPVVDLSSLIMLMIH